MNTILKNVRLALLAMLSAGQLNAAAAVDAPGHPTYATVRSLIKADAALAAVDGIETAYNRLRELAQTNTKGRYADATGDHDDVSRSITGALK